MRLKPIVTSNYGHYPAAALFLVGQFFGFSREDVVALRRYADDAYRPELDSIADRIEALLPPA